MTMSQSAYSVFSSPFSFSVSWARTLTPANHAPRSQHPKLNNDQTPIRVNQNGWNLLDALPDPHHTVQYLPGHIHAFYLEYVYYRQRDGVTRRAPGVYSERIQRGGHHETTYGTIHN
ncbi:hypothetical protein BDV33DRAFT_105837 [Aspergillus novoparasiticus]|uniref:Uncharacterized protein n=1 Tax=Aspergillus novoparasiticus TaxID=986946 RepID=A0A5N6EPX4_9EURO|nr:hypothetical protein BDV33DRAFT_105837 [Aspergillus novoparasiticus]